MNTSMMKVDDSFGECQSDACAEREFVGAILQLVETFEYFADSFLWNAGAIVLYTDMSLCVCIADGHIDFTSFWGIFKGI